MRSRLANALFRLAHRLDPGRPVVTAVPGGFEVWAAGQPLARISAGSVPDTEMRGRRR